MHIKGPIARGTIRTSLVLAARLCVQASTLLVVARLLGPHHFGAFAGISSLALILGTLSTFGTHLVLLGEVAQDPIRRDRVLSHAIPTTLLSGSCLLVIYLVAAQVLFPGVHFAVATFVAIGVAEILLQPILSLLISEQHALGKVARSQLLTIVPLALRLAAAVTVYLLHVEDPLTSYAFGYFLASMLALSLTANLVRCNWPRPRAWRLSSRSELRYAAGYAALNVTAAGPAELDKTLAARLLPIAIAGVYSAGARVIGAATLPVIALMLAALPRLFREAHAHPKRTQRLLRWIFGSAAAYSLGMTLILWWIAPTFVWLFGTQYQGLDNVIRWLCLSIPGLALRMAAGHVLMALGKPWMRVGFEITGIVILTASAVAFTNVWGAFGMPLALMSSEYVMAVSGWAAIRNIQHNK